MTRSVGSSANGIPTWKSSSGPLEVDAFLRRLLDWAETNSRGMGWQTYQVLLKAKAGATGTMAAWAVWEQSGRYSAGNGGVMRCAPVALRCRRVPERLIEDAANSARVTHYNPRCLWTTVAVCAVPGARFGPTAIPRRWIERLPNPWELEAVADRLWQAAESGLP